MWVKCHLKSLRLVPFEGLGAVSYSPSIVTMAVPVAVFEIFNVKELRDLENQFKIIENGAVRYTICDFLLVGHCKYSSILYHFRVFLMLNNIVTLKSGLEVTQCR